MAGAPGCAGAAPTLPGGRPRFHPFAVRNPLRTTRQNLWITPANPRRDSPSGVMSVGACPLQGENGTRTGHNSARRTPPGRRPRVRLSEPRPHPSRPVSGLRTRPRASRPAPAPGSHAQPLGTPPVPRALRPAPAAPRPALPSHAQPSPPARSHPARTRSAPSADAPPGVPGAPPHQRRRSPASPRLPPPVTRPAPLLGGARTGFHFPAGRRLKFFLSGPRSGTNVRGYSSVGRALAWHARGQEFDSP